MTEELASAPMSAPVVAEMERLEREERARGFNNEGDRIGGEGMPGDVAPAQVPTPQSIGPDAPQVMQQAEARVTGVYALVVAFRCCGCKQQAGINHPQALDDAMHGKPIGFKCGNCRQLNMMVPQGSPEAQKAAENQPRIITDIAKPPMMNRIDARFRRNR
jgi:hypothetical protein